MTSALKLGACFCLITSLIIAAWSLAQNPPPGLVRRYRAYTTDLDRRLRLLFLDIKSWQIVLAQIATIILAIVIFLTWKQAKALALVPIAVLAPRVVLSRLAQKRLDVLEERLDGFLLALANALRAQPNIGAALASLLPTAPKPIDEELELVVREMRVGSTLEEALLAFAGRVQSLALDTALSGLLIGRKIGGNVPEVLENTANALREMMRLKGVLRAKTSEGRLQTMILAVVPVVLVYTFDYMRPGYFAPLTASITGMIIIAVACVFWLAAVLLARKIMAVAL